MSLLDINQTQVAAVMTPVINNQGTQATEQTLITVMNSQGTQATAALQAASNSLLTVIMNNQGTQATSEAAEIATFTVVMNNQGTQATSAKQDTQISLASAILNAQGTQSTAGMATSANQSIQINNQGTQATSALQQTQVTLLTNISNQEGTLATAANQATNTAVLVNIMNMQGTQATSALQTALQSQQASTITTYGATGTSASARQATLMMVDPNSPSADAFSRLRTSHPDYRFDGQLIYQVSSDLWDSAFSVGGTITHDRVNKMAQVYAPANGTSVLQAHYASPYTPGRSQLTFLTFQSGTTPLYNCTRRFGYWNGTDGIYLEHAWDGVRLVLNSSTANGNQSVLQNAWNIDKMDGNGPSGLTLDLSKVQILVVSLQALYVGRVLVALDINGVVYPIHAFTHANQISYPYMANAGLPVRYEARSTGTNQVGLNAICASIMSEGGGPLSLIPSRTFSASTAPRTSVTVGNTAIPLLSVRGRQQINQVNNYGLILPTDLSYQCSVTSYVQLVRNATLTGAAWTLVDNTNSIAEYDITASAVSGGSVLWSSFANTSSGVLSQLSENLLGRLVIAYSHLLSSSDTLTIVGISTAGNAATFASMNWKEIR